MNDSASRPLTVLLHELSRRCASLGSGGIAALRESGREAGDRLYDDLGPLPETLPPAEFWETVDRKLRTLGLGSVRFEPVDPALGAVLWYGSPETAPSATGSFTGEEARECGSAEETGPIPGCHVATGFLAGLLTRAGGRPVAVLEVECGRGEIPLCRFLFGSPSRLLEVHRRLAAGSPPARALAALEESPAR